MSIPQATAPARVPEGPPATSRPGHWPELDLLRALACFCMILNHLAVESPGAAGSRFLSGSEFVGGFAPVLFYLATGIGYGVQSLKAGGRQGYGFLIKVGVLLVAGLDFFTFIGLSMLALEVIRRLPRSGWIAAGVGVAAILARFVGGTLFRRSIEGGEWGPWIGDVVGTGGHFGYPLGPWLAFPMLGYVVGRLAATHRVTLASSRLLPGWLALAAVPPTLACLALVARGTFPFRYGTMNASYFFASLAVVAASLSACVWVCRLAGTARLVSLISLSGLRSFAVVPLHYLLIALIAAAVGLPRGPMAFGAVLAVVVAASFVGSALFVALARWLDEPRRRVPACLVVLALTVAYYVAPRGGLGVLEAVAVTALFQLALCLVLSFRLRAAGRPPLPGPALGG